MAELLWAGAGTLFREIHITLLRDAGATRHGVLDALARTAKEVGPGDTFILYIAGHGIRTEPNNRFLFLPQDTHNTSGWAALRAQGIDDGTLVAALARIRAQDAVLLRDTCHAGQLTMEQFSALSKETGCFLLAASSSVQGSPGQLRRPQRRLRLCLAGRATWQGGDGYGGADQRPRPW